MNGPILTLRDRNQNRNVMITYFKRLSLLVIFVCLSIPGWGQDQKTWPVRHSMPDNPVAIPEVGPTGAANITIPLWEIKARGITIPIFLNYVTTGR